MATFGEITYMVLDMLKELHDDAYYTEEHIIFLAGRYRSFLLKQRYYSQLLPYREQRKRRYYFQLSPCLALLLLFHLPNQSPSCCEYCVITRPKTY